MTTPHLAHIAGLPRHFTVDTLRDYLLSRATRTAAGCLEFHGYGTNRRVYQKGPGRAWSHIAAYGVFVGPRDPALDVSHLCDNPPCIEPTHLIQETRAQNMARRAGRTNRISCTHPRERTPDGRLKRCRPCNVAAQRRWQERQRAEVAPPPAVPLFIPGSWTVESLFSEPGRQPL
ncbi:HNH endonuclease [Micromonospora humida]|uniref:HNH endonuclease n=1 Tax=Micromonospora humida TaxID=2809018 RepID=UPI003670005E